VLAGIVASSLAGSSIDLPSEPPGSEPGQIFQLQDYRWVPVTVKRTPTLVECGFQVVSGGATVRAELLTEQEFLHFRRRQDYEVLEETRPGHTGGFTHMIVAPGRYRVLVINQPGAPTAAVSLVVRATVDPPPSTVSVGITPSRQFTVIFAALTLFFGTVTWSGHKLLRAWRNR
jgi:hypothetical protein